MHLHNYYYLSQIKYDMQETAMIYIMAEDALFGASDDIASFLLVAPSIVNGSETLSLLIHRSKIILSSFTEIQLKYQSGEKPVPSLLMVILSNFPTSLRPLRVAVANSSLSNASTSVKLFSNVSLVIPSSP
mmetsp:Transcript_4836/g.5590  ORF Transcript_4836/g.5590 Transcript_4836/m.5590 type:complete len:131 (+) Transcript_4836:59-451(+)